MLVKCVKGPCKNCDGRHLLCHDSCERYKHYKDELARVKTNVLEAKRLEFQPWRDGK